MPGRHEHSAGMLARSQRARWIAGGAALATGATAVAVALLPAGAADAKTPQANYHSGSDKAVFTVTGVEDSNCLISTGGRTVYIKPGDRVDFSTDTAGVALNGLNIGTGKVLGLNVRASIDGGSSFSVPAGKTIKVNGLSKGTHSLAWSASSVGVHVPSVTKTITTKVTGPLGGLINKITHKIIPAHNLNIPLSNSKLKSGAQLSWAGKIYVTSSAPQCKISVQTPKTKVSVGPVHVTVPGQNVDVPGVTVPTKLPGVPRLDGGKKSTSPKKSTSSSSPNYNFNPPQLTVPEMVVPKGGSGDVYGTDGQGSYNPDLGTDNGSTTQLTEGSGGSTTQNGTSGGGSSTSNGGSGGASTGKTQNVDLASDAPHSSITGELPVLLAILAVIALALVAGTYARLYLLGRSSKK